MGDRILMMHQGQVRLRHRPGGKEKTQGTRPAAMFDDIRKKEQVDATTAEMLRQYYV
jgi:ABC-type uncharacterized transport system ATPase component